VRLGSSPDDIYEVPMHDIAYLYLVIFKFYAVIIFIIIGVYKRNNAPIAKDLPNL
jgi:hypothetical protein